MHLSVQLRRVLEKFPDLDNRESARVGRVDAVAPALSLEGAFPALFSLQFL